MLIENLFSSEPEEEVFGNIVELIATLSETSEDVQKILNDLLATDWGHCNNPGKTYAKQVGLVSDPYLTTLSVPQRCYQVRNG